MLKFQDISSLTSVGGEHLFFPSFLGGPRLRQRFVLKREDAKQVREIVKTLPIQVVCVLIPPSTNNLLPTPLGPPLKMCCKFPQNPLDKFLLKVLCKMHVKCVNFDSLTGPNSQGYPWVSYLLPPTNPSATSRWRYLRERPWNWA